MNLFELLNIDRSIEIVDIVANPIDGDPPYKTILKAGYARVTGFEPQLDPLAKLEEKRVGMRDIFPAVLAMIMSMIFIYTREAALQA